MLTLAQAFSDAFNEIDDKYVVEAIQYRRYKTKRVQLKWILIAAALLVGLSITTMAAIRLFGLRGLVLDPVQNPMQTYHPDSEMVQTDPERPIPSGASPVQTNTAISLSGYMNTPESQALAEWQVFLETYDQDHAILNSVGNHVDENLRRYAGYSIYTQEMMDELEQIADKYGLKLHTESYDLFAHPELIAPCEGYLGQNRGSALYMYEDGSFHVDGMASVSDFGVLDYQLQRSVRGTLHSSYLTIMDVNDYQEWTHETACGVPVVLALGPSKALILADMEDCFVTINCLIGTNSGLTEANLEELADSFDFSKLDPVVVPDLTDIPDDSKPMGPPASERTTARETYAAVLRDLLYSGILPDLTKAEPMDGADLSQNQFAVLDVNCDGEEDLILLYTTAITAGQRGMVISFDETYTGTARPIHFLLDGYSKLTFFNNGYIAVGAKYNLTWSEFWPYALYEMEDHRFYSAVDISAQDKTILELIGRGEEYPDNIDVSGTGRVYQVIVSYNAPGMQPGPYLWDAAEYEAWVENTLGSERTIPYLSLTEENIAWMESQ